MKSFKLPEKMDTRAAEPLRNDLLRELPELIDCSAVKILGALSAQVLVSYILTQERQTGYKITFCVSGVFVDYMRLLGLSEYIYVGGNGE